MQDRVYLAAVCDRCRAGPSRPLQYGVKAAYVAYEDLLADPNVDAVTLCSPIGLHHQQGMMALEAGKHIHFNKTMTTEGVGGRRDHQHGSGQGLRSWPRRA